MSNYTIEFSNIREFTYDDLCCVALSRLGGIYDNGNDDDWGLAAYQIEVDVTATNNETQETRTFHCIYQPEERTTKLKAYCGYEMIPAGTDEDESDDLFVFIKYRDELLAELHAEIKELAKAELERLLTA